ncbi:MAG: cob(I)alamin adenosyltransferase, partial [Moorella sp. (in: firmicutes)]|nr:cob(I)alamin adenosyltransferase [Moorella sp. (in: firmicutes)]
ILDEINNALYFGLLTEEEVLAFLMERPPHVEVILTGRNAPPRIIEVADLVTEMRQVKHPYEKGIKARKGIEY